MPKKLLTRLFLLSWTFLKMYPMKLRKKRWAVSKMRFYCTVAYQHKNNRKNYDTIILEVYPCSAI